MRKILAALTPLMLVSCVSPPGFDYTGSDAGALILSLSAGETKVPLSSFSLFLHRAQANDSEDAVLLWMSPYIAHGPFETDYLTGTKIDQTGNTDVYVRKLKPGDYTILSVTFESPAPNGWWAGAEKMNLAFTVKPNQATYLGSFVAYAFELPKTNPIVPLSEEHPSLALLFTVNSQYERDVQIALHKHPELDGVTNSVPDPTKLGLPFGPSPSKT